MFFAGSIELVGMETEVAIAGRATIEGSLKTLLASVHRLHLSSSTPTTQHSLFDRDLTSRWAAPPLREGQACHILARKYA